MDILNRQEGAVSRLIANTGVVFGALTERDGQLRSLIQNSNTVFATTAARDTQLQAAFRALPTFEDESRATFERLTTFAARHRPADHPAAPGGARAVADARRTSRTSRPTCKNLLEQLQPLIDASVKRLPGGRADAGGRAAAASASSTRRPRS